MLKKRNLYFTRPFIIVMIVLPWLIFPSSARAADWALSFDGIDDYVEIADNPILNFGEGSFSIEAWVKTSVKDYDRDIAGRGFNSNAGYMISISGGSGTAEFLIQQASPYDYAFIYGTGNDLSDNSWHHIIGVRDALLGQTFLYVDGNKIGETSDKGLNTNTTELNNIGTGWNGYFDGSIDEIRIYSRALPANEVSAHYSGVFSDATGLVGLWHFNEGSGTTAIDSSGQGNNGSINNAVWTGGVVFGETAGAAGDGFGIENATPQVKLESHFKGTYRGDIPIYYTASDPDTGTGALKNEPLYVFYSNDGGYRWERVTAQQSNTGVYIFDSTKVPDGTKYKIRLVVLDGYDYPGNADSEVFAIDNTSPTFEVSVLSPLPIREKDTIELKITSSEELKASPEVQIIQSGAEPKAITASGTGKEFSASCYVVRGYRGEAVIAISGEDLVGNIGTTISSGETFLVERYGPPAPVIETPIDNQIFTQATINLIGSSELETEVIITLNEATKWTLEPLSDGTFGIDKINLTLTTDNKGYNALKIIAFNQKGEDSEEIVLNLKLNSPPTVSSTSTLFGETLSGEKEITWVSSDLNEDQLIFSIEYSNDGGVSWDFIVSDISETIYQIDTTQLADGADYLLKLTADDGTEKASQSFENITIKNNLPHIALDIPSNYFINTSTPAFTGKITGSEQNISSVEYSLDRGATWQGASALDGQFDSLIEEMEIAIAEFLAEGKYTILIRTTDALDRSVKISRSFNVDITLPFVELPLLNQLVEDTRVVFEGKTEALAGIKLVLEDKTYRTSANENGEFVIEDVALGVHGSNQLALLSTDLAGNITQVEGVIVSDNLPQITVLDLKEGDFLGGIKEINWQVEDLDNDPVVSKILYQKKGEEWLTLAKDLTSNTYNWNVSRFANGDYRIKIIASDGISEKEEILNVFIDNIAPQVVFKALTPPLTDRSRLSFSGQASDEFSGIQYVEYSLDNIDWYQALVSKDYQGKKANFRFRPRSSITDGEYEIRVRATDIAGNIAYAKPLILTVDTLSPRIGSSLIYSESLILFPDEEGVIKLFKDTPYKILFSVAQDAKEVILSSGEMIFDLNFNQATLLWESEFSFEELGEYPLTLTVQDKIGNSQTKEIAAIEVVPWGVVYDKETSVPLKEANVTLYFFDDKTSTWFIWDGRAFNQQNPQETDETGRYSFLVPPGKYRLEIEKLGFNRVKSKELVIKNNYLINADIPLTAEKGVLDKILNYFIKLFGF